MGREKEGEKKRLSMANTRVAGKEIISMAMEKKDHWWELFLKGIGRRGEKMEEAFEK